MSTDLILLAERVYALYLFVPMRVRADLFPQDLLVVLRMRLLVYLLAVPVMTNSLFLSFLCQFTCVYKAEILLHLFGHTS
jgi:hypothetical protein